MAADRTDEKAIEALLKRRAAWPAQAPGADCPDAGVLAAFYERSLTADELRTAESHVSTCLRCQEQLALLARSEPAVAALHEEKAAAGSSLWAWKWLAPLATVAAVAIVWVAVRPGPPRVADISSNRPAVAQTETAKNTNDRAQAPPAPPAVAEAVTVAKEAPQQHAAARASGAGNKQLADAASSASKDKVADADAYVAGKLASNAAPATEAPAHAGERNTVAANQAVGRSNSDSKSALEMRAAAPPAANVVTAPGEAKLDASANRNLAQNAEERRESEKQQQKPAAGQAMPANADQIQTRQQQNYRVQAPQSQAEGYAQPAPAQGAMATPETRAKVAQAEVSSAMQEKSRRDAPPLDIKKEEAGQFGAVAKRPASGLVFVSSPNGEATWRFTKDGSIDVSPDGGKTWFSQASPVDVAIVGGSAPSSKACWAITRDGTVLLKIAGADWKKAGAVNENLVAITAKDAQTATITTASGLRFTTTDGGRTWKRE